MGYKTKHNFFWVFPKILALFFLLPFFLIFLFFIGYFISLLLTDQLGNVKNLGLGILKLLAYSIGGAFIFYWIFNTLFKETFTIEIKAEGLYINYFFLFKTHLYEWSEISGFSTSTFYNRQKSFDLIRLHLSNGKNIKVSEETIRDYKALIEELKKAPLNYMGYEEPLPLTRR